MSDLRSPVVAGPANRAELDRIITEAAASIPGVSVVPPWRAALSGLTRWGRPGPAKVEFLAGGRIRVGLDLVVRDGSARSAAEAGQRAVAEALSHAGWHDPDVHVTVLQVTD